MSKKRTLKQDRELAIQLAEKLGHEMGPWESWVFQPRRICFCKVCYDWVGLTNHRNWEYNKKWMTIDKGITGTAIMPKVADNYTSGWRTKKCSGIKEKAILKRIRTKEYNKILKIIIVHSAERAAEILSGKDLEKKKKIKGPIEDRFEILDL